MTGSPEETGCPVCGSEAMLPWLRAREMFDGDSFTLSRCRVCGLARTDGELAPADLATYYRYAGGADAGRRFIPALEPLMRALRSVRVRTFLRGNEGPGRVPDVGCGRGVMLKTLARLGWDAYGTEIDGDVAATARAELGNRIRTGDFAALDFPMQPFDLVTFWHVLEHLPDPQAALGKAAEITRPGGRIVVAVPNLDSWQARAFGALWLHLDVPRHRWHFSARTLTRLGQRVGLQVETVKHFSLEYGPYGWLQGLLSRCGLGNTLFTDILRPGRRDRLLGDSRFWAHVLLALPIAAAAVLALPAELAAAAAGHGGAITITFRRPADGRAAPRQRYCDSRLRAALHHRDPSGRQQPADRATHA